MLKAIIFIQSSLLASSFAHSGRSSTNGYSSEWQFRENVMNIGSTPSIGLHSNGEKSTTYQTDWKPIIVTRSSPDREPRFNQNVVTSQTFNLQTPKPWKWSSSYVENRISSKFPPMNTKIAPAINIKNEPLSILVTRESESLKRPDITRNNSHSNEQVITDSGRRYFSHPEKRKRVVLREDDIMLMHYQPLSRNPIPKFRPFVNNHLLEVRHNDLYDGDMMMQDKSMKVEGNKNAFFVTAGLPTTTESTPHMPTTLITPRPRYSKNIFDVIDKTNIDDFKPMIPIKRQTMFIWPLRSTTVATEEENSTEIDSTWQNVYNAFYGNDDLSTRKPAQEFKAANFNQNVRTVGGFFDNNNELREISEVTKFETQNIRQRENKQANTVTHFSNVTKPQNISQDNSWLLTMSAKSADKQIKMLPKEVVGKKVKFFTKPIVIAEAKTPSTGKYYRQLNDSFGEQNDYDDQAYDWHSGKNSNDAYNKVDRNLHKVQNVSSQAAVQDEGKKNFTSEENCKSDEIPVHESHQTWRLLFNMTGVHFSDFIPMSLRTNIFLVKKLLVECYPDIDKKDNLNDNTVNCLKKITFKMLDRAIQSDVLKITDTVSLVKENNTDVDLLNGFRSATANVNQDPDWLETLLEKIRQLFSTHSLKVQLSSLQDKEHFQVEGRRRHYRKVFPIMVGAYMILSTVLIPLGFKFMTLLGTKSLLVSKLSLVIAMMGSIKKYMGYTSESTPHAHYPSYYPSYPSYPYYDPWRREELRKAAAATYDDPIEYSHYTEELE